MRGSTSEVRGEPLTVTVMFMRAPSGDWSGGGGAQAAGDVDAHDVPFVVGAAPDVGAGIGGLGGRSGRLFDQVVGDQVADEGLLGGGGLDVGGPDAGKADPGLGDDAPAGGQEDGDADGGEV